MYKLTFNGIEPPSFLKVTGIDQNILPDIEHYNTAITGMYGNIDGGIALNSKRFTVNYIIQYEPDKDDSYYIDQLATWCMGDNYKIGKLKFDDTAYYYNARVTDASDFTDSILYGSGSIVFTASDPRKYSETMWSKTLSSTETVTVTYTGILPSPPIFYLTGSSKTTSIKIDNTANGDSVTISGKAGELSGNIVIDCNRKYVSVGGVKHMELLTIDSDWIKLIPGDNPIAITVGGTDITSATVKLRLFK